MKLRVLAIAVILLLSVSSAQSSENVDPEPGLVKAGGLAHGLDVVFDNGLMSIGVKSPGDVAFERASEASVAVERNNSRGSDRALQQLEGVLARSDHDDLEDLEKTESVLNNVSERVPDEASQDVDNALESVDSAKNRMPEELTREGMDSSGLLPDVELPRGGGGDVDVPGSEASSSREG